MTAVRLKTASVLAAFVTIGTAATAQTTPVTVENFVRAETDATIAVYAKESGLGKFLHSRTPPSIDDQKIVRMNRDTLYSFGIFDLEAGPVTLDLPDAGKRYMMAQVIDEDHYTHDISYAPGSKTYSKDEIGTRYMIVIIRTLVDPQDKKDVDDVHALQDKITVRQAAQGRLEVPAWDAASQSKVRDALKVLGSTLDDSTRMFGSKDEVDPVRHLIGAAIGWGGNPTSAAVYVTSKPKDDSGTKVQRLTVKDVPVDGFWSISVYNSAGFFQKNELGSYSINNLTAKPDANGAYVIQFGGCTKATVNCIPTMKGWNYTVRLYRPRTELLDGKWTFPEPEVVQ